MRFKRLALVPMELLLDYGEWECDVLCGRHLNCKQYGTVYRDDFFPSREKKKKKRVNLVCSMASDVPKEK